MTSTKTTDAQKSAAMRYIKAHQDRMSVITSKENGAVIREFAAAMDMSVNAFILSAINHEIALHTVVKDYAGELSISDADFVALAVEHYLRTPRVLDSIIYK